MYTIRKIRLALSIVICVFSINVSGYEIDSHKALTRASINESVLKSSDNNPLEDIGLIADIDNKSQVFSNSKGEIQTVNRLIIDGSAFEDDVSIPDLEIRPINHFYDPVHERAPLPVSEMSPDWMLEDRYDVELQAYSWKDANEAFYRALTLPTEAERNAELGKVFESLGRIVHHIQDMAQPQHVRKELHCDAPIFEALDALLLQGILKTEADELEQIMGSEYA